MTSTMKPKQYEMSIKFVVFDPQALWDARNEYDVPAHDAESNGTRDNPKIDYLLWDLIDLSDLSQMPPGVGFISQEMFELEEPNDS
jgi:hypothetical protein